MPKYKGTEGELISIEDANKYTCAHVDCKHPDHEDNFVEAEFFGLKTFNKLLDECGGKPVGFRVYYGIRHEDRSKNTPIECSEEEGGKPTPRLIIVPVDANGKDLTGLNSARGIKIDSNEGSRAMSAVKGKALANGPQCPSFC